MDQPIDRPIDLNDLAQTPTQPRAYLAWMRHQLTRITYKPNWDMTIQTDGTLIIRYHAIDSRNPSLPKRFEAHRALTPTGDPHAFATEILGHLDDIEKHETREWFRVDGKLFADPHTDPTQRHCPNCGGVGKPHTCPGCGHTTEQTRHPEDSPGAVLGSPSRAQDGQLKTAITDDVVLCHVALIDLAESAVRLYGSVEKASAVYGHPVPAHDFRWHLTYEDGAEVTFHRGASADAVAAELEREARERGRLVAAAPTAAAATPRRVVLRPGVAMLGGQPIAAAAPPPRDTEATPRAAAQHLAGLLWRLAGGLAERGIELAPDAPIDEAPVVTALAEVDRLRTELDARPRRVWFAGDPEPDIDTRVLVAGNVWTRHHQLRWILWPGGNGCPGIDWERLAGNDGFPLIEVLPHEQVKKYGGLIREAAASTSERDA